MAKKIVMYVLCSLFIMPIAYAAMHNNENKKTDIKNLKDCKMLSDYHALQLQTRAKKIHNVDDKKIGDDHGVHGNNSNSSDKK